MENKIKAMLDLVGFDNKIPADITFAVFDETDEEPKKEKPKDKKVDNSKISYKEQATPVDGHADRNIVRVNVPGGKVEEAVVIEEENGLTKLDATNALMVAFCKQASRLMHLDFNNLFGKMADVLMSEATAAIFADLLGQMMNEEDDGK